VLNHGGSLSEPDFELIVDGWAEGDQLVKVDRLAGVCIRIKIATRSHTNVAGHSHSELPLLPMTGVRYEADIS
jgi:hypothetical protein